MVSMDQDAYQLLERVTSKSRVLPDFHGFLKIGRGGQATVYSALRKCDDQPIAVKIMSLDDNSENEWKHITEEQRAM